MVEVISRSASEQEERIAGRTPIPERAAEFVLSPAERHLLLVEWCDTRRDVPLVPLVHEIVAERARLAPEAIAVVDGGRRLTYGELDARANGLAHRLRAEGVGPEVRVALLAGRSIELVLGVLAVLKAGGGYVSIDPRFPRERQLFMLEDSGAAVLLVQPHLGTDLPESGVPALPLEVTEIPRRAVPPASGAGPENLAYLIYTSGSTGKPKGTQIEHASLTRLLSWHQETLRFAAGERATLFSGPSFDVSVWEIWSGLAAGASLHIPDEECRASAPRMIRWLTENAIEHGLVSTPLAELMIDEPWPAPTALRTLTTGGDRLRRWLGADFPCPLFNIYGPSEATVVTTCFTLLPGAERDGLQPPIGRPLDNVRVHLLDADLRLVPPGTAGELWVGGGGLGRGYLDRPELTAEKFAPDPFAGERGEPGARLYRTGDLARYLPDGNLEFLGRADFQIKIRGFRIEPGEIEAELLAHPGIREAVVLPRQDGPGGTRLVAYLAPGVPAPETGEVRDALGARLPDYMVPSAFVWLEALPLTPNGKVDRRALAEIGVAPVSTEPYAAPRTESEEILAGLWAELLRLDRVGIRDPFVHLGGHSMLAVQVLSRVRRLFGVDLSVQTLFDARTVEGLARAIAKMGEAERSAGVTLARTPRDGELPLSFAQARLWFLDRVQQGSALYNVPQAYRLRGRLEPGALAASLGEIVRRHEALRTRFAEGVDGPVQVIDPSGDFVLPRVDLGSLPEPAREGEEERLAAEAARRPFDLARGPLFRALLLRAGASEWTLVLAMHHIVSDGWSTDVLAGELGALYGAALAGAPSPLPEPPLQYADFAVWQRDSLRGEVLESQLAYWREHLAGAPTVLELPTDRPRPAEPSFRGALVGLRLSPALTGSLRDLARRSGATLFMTALAGFELLLHRYTGQTDLLMGTPVAGRGREELEGLIGFFVNTLVVRGRLDEDPTVLALLGRVRAEVLGVSAHSELPFDKLVEELAPARSLSRSPLIQTIFTLRDARWEGLELPGIASRPLYLDIASAKFDFGLSLTDSEDGLAATLEYATDLFDAATASRMLGHFERLLAGMSAAPDRPISRLEALSPAERQQLFVEWNDSEAMEAEEHVPGWFAAQARERPGALALEAGGERLTYGDLEARANRLAHRLRSQGVEREVLVGVCLERTADLVVSVLAVFKAGGAYLPLDPSYPKERLAYVLEDSGAAVLISQRWLIEGLPWKGRGLLLLAEQAEELAGESAANPGVEIRPSDLAYVIYTSGSTGRPKGVQVEHGHLSNVLRSSRLAFGFEASDVMPALAPFSFDIFLFELLNPLVVGGRSVLVSLEGGPDLGLLAGLLGQVTRLHAVPALMQQIVERVRSDGAAGGYPNLRTLFTGGDAVPASLLAELRETFPASGVRVLYGPTEATIIASSSAVPEQGAVRSLLGRPLGNMTLRLCDALGRPVPVGVPGEIWIGGRGVARGYLGRPELTAERYPMIEGERWYRTGDLARRLPDGALEFLGRSDDQVKIRGFRIELGEVEAALLSHPGVREATVLALGEGAGKRLVAYVSALGASLAAAAVREHLRVALPDYMVPSAFAELESLPLTANGKVDRQALARMAVTGWETEGEYVAPRTPVERALARIWKELLEQDRIGVRDDFFQRGGHSLLAVQVLSRVRRLFGVELSVRTLFDTPTVEALARRIEQAREGTAGPTAGSALVPGLLPASRDGELPLSFAQARLWFLDRVQLDSSVYNMPLAYRLGGPLEPAALAAALGEIVRRHEALRTRFAEGVDGPVQVIDPSGGFVLPWVDLGSLPEPARGGEEERLAAEEARRPFDLARGPLFRALLLRAGASEWTLVLAMHHIVSDGWSTDVLAGELAALYGAVLAGTPSPLPEPPLQYADFAVWQRDSLRGEALESQLAYWREHLAGAPTVLELPTDRPHPAEPSFRGALAGLRLSPVLTRSLRDLARRSGSTLFMTALAGFELLLHRYTGQSDLLIGTPVAGRGREELEGLIGFFVNTLVVRGRLEGDPTVFGLLGRVRAEVLGVSAHSGAPLRQTGRGAGAGAVAEPLAADPDDLRPAGCPVGGAGVAGDRFPSPASRHREREVRPWAVAHRFGRRARRDAGVRHGPVRRRDGVADAGPLRAPAGGHVGGSGSSDLAAGGAVSCRAPAALPGVERQRGDGSGGARTGLVRGAGPSASQLAGPGGGGRAAELWGSRGAGEPSGAPPAVAGSGAGGAGGGLPGAYGGPGGVGAGGVQGGRRLPAARSVLSEGAPGLRAGGLRSGGADLAAAADRGPAVERSWPAAAGRAGGGAGGGERGKPWRRDPSVGPGLRDLHLGLDGPSEGSAGRAREPVERAAVEPPGLRLRRNRRDTGAGAVLVRHLPVRAAQPAGGGRDVGAGVAGGWSGSG